MSFSEVDFSRLPKWSSAMEAEALEARSVRELSEPASVPNWEATACLRGCLELPGSASPAKRQDAATPQLGD